MINSPDSITSDSTSAELDSTELLLSELEKIPILETESIAFSYETIGWKILLAIILLLVSIITFLAIRRYLKNAYKRKAIATLNQLTNIDLEQNSVQAINEIFTQLKIVAIQSYGRKQVAGMNDLEWLNFLDSKIKSNFFLEHKKTINTAIYEGKKVAKEEVIVLNNKAKNWIKKHAG